jgi:hypothetical protein
MNNIPQELNWVEKRAACSVESVFREIQAGVENDIAIANAIRRFAPDNYFGSRLTSNGRVLVVAQLNVTGPRVVFMFQGETIEVREEATSTRWVCTVTLNDEGRCKLKLEDGTELEQWQLRKFALESLFFTA